MGLRQKFRNVHVVLSRPPDPGGHPKGYVMRSSLTASYVFTAQQDLPPASLLEKTPHINGRRIFPVLRCTAKQKGIDSLAQLCREKLDADPFSGCLFIFRNRSGKSIRILTYDEQGFWIATKRLSKGRFKWWPTGTEPAKTLRAHQAQLLLAAGNPETDAAPVWRRVS